MAAAAGHLRMPRITTYLLEHTETAIAESKGGQVTAAIALPFASPNPHSTGVGCPKKSPRGKGSFWEGELGIASIEHRWVGIVAPQVVGKLALSISNDSALPWGPTAGPPPPPPGGGSVESAHSAGWWAVRVLGGVVVSGFLGEYNSFPFCLSRRFVLIVWFFSIFRSLTKLLRL